MSLENIFPRTRNLTISRTSLKNLLQEYPLIVRILVYHYWQFKLYSKLLIKILLFRFPLNKRIFQYRKPTVLQLPITYKCNLDCIMCGMSNMRNKAQFTPDELSKLIRNKLFKNIKSVGVNGGEPFLLPNLQQYIAVLMRDLPRLKNIYIITNGYLTDKILLTLEKIKEICSKDRVKLTVSVSIDGINETHDIVRGKCGVFAKSEKTCFSLIKNKNKYCDQFGVICTITKHNIYNINEVDMWAKSNKIDIAYNIATLHKRLFNEAKFEDFSVFSDEHTRLLAAEFFYSKFINTKSSLYWALYRYASDKKRRTGCIFKYDGVTVTPDGNISYCATRSDVLGNGFNEDSHEIFRRNVNYRNKIIKNDCVSCSHYIGGLTLRATLDYNKEILSIIGNPFMYHC